MARVRKPFGASTWPSLLAGAAALLGATLASTFAHAQQDAAAAEALFDKGLAEMQAGHFDAACPAFAESQRLDPRAGTLFTLAECERLSGKIASAFAHYAEYLRLFEGMPPALRQKHEERAALARKERASLEPTIPRLTLVLPKTAPPRVRVTRDGLELGAASLGTALPVDPGEHVLTTQVPDAPPVEQRVTVAKGEAKTVELDVRVAGAPQSPEPPAIPPTPPPIPTPEPTGRDVPTWAWIAGIGGLAAIGGSVTFTVLHMNVRRAVADRCPDGTCDTPGLAQEYRASWDRDLGLAIGFGALGALGLGAAVTGIVGAGGKTKAPEAVTLVPWATKSAGGATLVGRF